MTDERKPHRETERPAQPNEQPDEAPPAKNMHEEVETWEDTCVCEPEPHWQQVADEREQEADQHPD